MEKDIGVWRMALKFGGYWSLEEGFGVWRRALEFGEGHWSLEKSIGA